MSWLVVILVVWLVVSVVAAVLIGRMVHLADLRSDSESRGACEACALTDDQAPRRCAAGDLPVAEAAPVKQMGRP